MSKFLPFKDLILMEDENLIAINKPAGISSLDERSNQMPSIISMAKKYEPDAQLCHRIDKETSGVLLIARNEATYRAMAMKFEAREVDKIYHAVVGGFLQVSNKSILLPLSLTKNGLAKVDVKEGKKAETIISTIQTFNHYTLLECKPVSGRLHQIRVHMASQNFPLVSDTSYGGKVPMLSHFKRNFKTGKEGLEQGMMKRVALHAYRLLFELDGKQYDIIAPYPKDFDVFIKQLQKFDSGD
ncbi:MAG: RluA family pseudouridine synthase [Bacteroidota bacterium]|jgi:23S rRNA pseudouridine955/2504/2580 synthase|nr:pseudouridine synthase [Sphingobacteriales bacterium]